MPNPAFGPGPNLEQLEDYVTIAGAEETRTTSPLEEMGQSGLKRSAGIVDEEFLPALRGRKAVKVYQEMSLNDPTVGALLFTITQLLRNVEWRVEATDNTPEATEHKDFVEQCMDDMSHTWDDMIADILSCLVYGWSWHEIVYKKRVGPWERDPKKKSKYTDGKIGWRKIAIRSQETLLRWIFDDDGGIKAMIQLAPPHYKTTILPIERSLLFRTDTAKGNPEGMSLLRRAYRPWFFKKRLEEFEAIGVERDLAGMPTAYIPANYMDAKPGTREYKVFQAFKKMVSNVRRDEHEGLVLPMQYDRNSNKELFRFELLSSGGSRTFDTNALIGRYEQRILMTVLADFILVGHQGTGSYSLHVDKTGIFRSALNSMAKMIADVFNRHAIPRLFELNGIRPEELPKIVPANVDPPDLNQLASFMAAMGGLGMEWFPDADLEEFLRNVARLPKMPDERLEMRRKMSEQYTEMSFTEQQMQYLGLNQKMDMVQNGGFSPEQAQMESENPNDDQVAHQTEQQMYQQGAQGQQEDERMAQQMAMQAEANPEQAAMQEREYEREDQVRAMDEESKERDFVRQMQQRLMEEESKTAEFERRIAEMEAQEKSRGSETQRKEREGAIQDRFKQKDSDRRVREMRMKPVQSQGRNDQSNNRKPAQKKPAPKKNGPNRYGR